MKIVFTSQFKKDVIQLKTENSKLLTKLLELIITIESNPENPLEGIGKPEQLRGNLSGFVTQEESTQSTD